MNQENIIKVFVYGTLKPRGKYYKIFCEGKTIEEQECWTKGSLFALPVGYPAMIEGNDQVYGYVLSFASFKDLENLDKLEGYSGIPNSPLNEYDRAKIIVYNQANQAIDEVWSYFMTEEKVKTLNGVYLPSGMWHQE
ncbi:gamma-glutamylcyclotransferase family protein [Geminocystis sp. CENA526]